MKAQTEEEILENTSEKSYDELLEDLKRLQRVSARLYVPALCVAYKREHLTLENDEIRRHVKNDCLLIGLWKSESTITEAMPKWIRTERLNTRKLEEAINSPEEQTRQQETSLLTRTTEQIETELSTEQEPESETTYSEGTVYEAPHAEMPHPMDVYTDTVKSAEKLWSALTTTNIHKPTKLIPAETSDPLIDFIKPSRKIWLRTLKGLEQPDVNHMLKCLIWLDKLIQDRLKDAQEIIKEKTEIQK